MSTTVKKLPAKVAWMVGLSMVSLACGCPSHHPSPSSKRNRSAVAEGDEPRVVSSSDQPIVSPPRLFVPSTTDPPGEKKARASSPSRSARRAARPDDEIGDLLDEGRLAEAASRIEQTLGGATDARLLFLARIRISQRKHAKAAALARRFLSDHPESAEAHAVAARAMFLKRELGRALRHAQKAVSLDQRKVAYRRLLGEILVRRKEYGAAAKTLKEATRLAPKDAWSLVLLGDAFWGRKSWNQAMSAYRKAAGRQARGEVWKASALDKLATLYNDRRDRAKAKKTLEECRKRFPKLGCPYAEAALSPPDPTRPHRKETYVRPAKKTR
jgi:tetratricopeptide (TPR) repeat protein